MRIVMTRRSGQKGVKNASIILESVTTALEMAFASLEQDSQL